MALFFKEIAVHPSKMGTIWPSSKALGKYMANAIPKPHQGYVVELGGGTGVITRALLASGITPSQLVVIERSKNLSDHLRKQFPQITVIQGDACELGSLLGDKASAVHAIVSGLPLLSLPESVQQGIIKAIEQLPVSMLHVIQFTYRRRAISPLDQSPLLTKVRSQRVIWNLPPAWVNRYQLKR